MTKTEWLVYANNHRGKLVSLISIYHPVNEYKGIRPSLPITAQNAEAACVVVRNEIRKNSEGNPELEFMKALESQDVLTMNRILNQVWFGIPESTTCWDIEGFREAITLMEDLPEEFYENY